MILSPEMRAALKQLLVKHEGYKNFPYLDTEGNITIGIGYNLTSRGLPDTWINHQYEEDVKYFHEKLLEDYPWYEHLDDIRKMVLINMCFMGYRKFQSFKKMINCLSLGDYRGAAREMMDSKWAEQVKSRANQIAVMMLSGEMKWAS